MSHDDDLHPAYARILSDLAPDEARILRLLYTDGRAAGGRRADQPAAEHRHRSSSRRGCR